MLKICVITTSFPRQENSPQGIFIKKFIENFNNDIQFTVLAPSDKKDCTIVYEKYKVKWVRYSLKKWENIFGSFGGLPQKLKGSIFTFWNLPFFVLAMMISTLKNSRKNDVLHVQWLQNGVFAILPKLIWRKPFVVTIHGTDFKLFLSKKTHNLIGRIVLYFTDAIITVNEDFEKILKEKYPQKNIKYIPYAYKINYKNESLINKCEFKTIVFVGALIEGKGVLDLMEVYDILFLEKLNIKLNVIGDGFLKEKLLLWSQKFPQNRVRISGSLSNEDVISEMNQSDVLVLPSYSEGRPTVILEAMANGLPVIATNLDGIKEIVKSDYNGKLFNPGDISEFSSILRNFINEKLPLDDYVRNSFTVLTEKGITIDNNIKNHLFIYNSIVYKK